MAQKTRAELQAKFKTHDRPTQQDFYDWLDSFYHKTEDTLPGSGGGGGSVPQRDILPNQTGSSITTTLIMPTSGLAARVWVFREGLKIRHGDDYSITGATFSLVIPAASETFEIFIF